MFCPPHRGHRVRLCGQAFGRVDGHHAATGDHRDAVGQRGGLLQVVGGEHDGGAVGGEHPDQVPELAARLGIETGGGFVHEQQFGIGDDAERDVEPTALPAREGPYPGAGGRRESDEVEHVVGVAGLSVALPEHPDRLGDREHAEVAGVLQHDADPGPPLPIRGAGVRAEHPHLTRVACAMALEDLDGGGLPGAVGPEDRDDLAVRDVQVDVADGGQPAVGLAQPADLDGRGLVCRGHGWPVPSRSSSSARSSSSESVAIS